VASEPSKFTEKLTSYLLLVCVAMILGFIAFWFYMNRTSYTPPKTVRCTVQFFQEIRDSEVARTHVFVGDCNGSDGKTVEEISQKSLSF
jgi:hypothetical protein